jgi:hypothetical protein
VLAEVQYLVDEGEAVAEQRLAEVAFVVLVEVVVFVDPFKKPL